jgi:hypothetical protein
MRSDPDLLGKRITGNSLMAEIFEGMHDMHFAADALEAAEFCLRLLSEKLHYQAGFAHFIDATRRDFVVAKVMGEGLTPWVSKRLPARDPVLSAAAKSSTAMVMTVFDADEIGQLERYAGVTGGKHVICARSTVAGRPLALFELVNPGDELPFTVADGAAVTYLAEQFGTFVASHGVELDPNAIRRASMLPARISSRPPRRTQ